MKKLLSLLVVLCAFACRAMAQVPIPTVTGGVVVANCGTPPANYPTAGNIGPELHDTNGNLCSGVTVTASIATGGLATSANQTNAAQKTQVVDGSGNVIGSTSNALNVNITGGSTGNGAASNTGSAVPTQGDYQGINVAGTLRGNTGVNPSGTVYAAQTDMTSVNGVTTLTGTGATGTGAQRVTVAQDANTIAGSAVGTAGTASSNVVTVQGIASGTALPISGTVTANAGTNLNTSALATSANQTNGTQEAKIVDGSGNVLPTLPSGATVVANADSVVASYEALVKGGTASAMTGTTSTQVIAAVASQNIYVTSCSVNNTSASVNTLVDLQDGSAGTVIWTFTAADNYGGESHVFGTHPLKVPTQGNGLYAVDETTGASVKIYCNGFSSANSY